MLASDRRRIVTILYVVLKFQVDCTCFQEEKRAQMLVEKWNERKKK